MKKQSGQVLVLLILVMTIALATGLSIIQKSLSDISSASKVEQSSRAFSAAEAGIEKALKGDSSGVDFSDNSSKANILDQGLQPPLPIANIRQIPLEFQDKFYKEDVAQVWLADLNSVANPPALFYKQNSLDIYWGNSTSDKAALEVTLIYYDGSKYTTKKWYLDHSFTRTPDNGFEKVNCSGYSLGTSRYQCKKTLDSFPSNLMLLRARLLYNTNSQPIAVQAVGICGNDCSIPPQVRMIYSTGISGETQRRVRVSRQEKVVPPYFDYAIFSSGDITK